MFDPYFLLYFFTKKIIRSDDIEEDGTTDTNPPIDSLVSADITLLIFITGGKKQFTCPLLCENERLRGTKCTVSDHFDGAILNMRILVQKNRAM